MLIAKCHNSFYNKHIYIAHKWKAYVIGLEVLHSLVAMRVIICNQSSYGDKLETYPRKFKISDFDKLVFNLMLASFSSFDIHIPILLRIG